MGKLEKKRKCTYGKDLYFLHFNDYLIDYNLKSSYIQMPRAIPAIKNINIIISVNPRCFMNIEEVQSTQMLEYMSVNSSSTYY
jgi:hypothetical protein